MSKKKKTSYFIRYKNQKWIPYRYILYSYWFDFLKIASEEKRKIDWKFYKDWGGKKILDVSFRTFWVHNWERLFQVESEYTPVDKIKYPMRSFQIKPDGIKRDLFVCKYKEMDNHTLFDLMISKKLISENNSQVGKTINKHRRNSEDILKNVCVGKFP